MTPEALRLADEIEELKIRQHLRQVLFDAYKLLTNPESTLHEIKQFAVVIRQTLEDTTP